MWKQIVSASFLRLTALSRVIFKKKKRFLIYHERVCVSNFGSLSFKVGRRNEYVNKQIGLKAIQVLRQPILVLFRPLPPNQKKTAFDSIPHQHLEPEFTGPFLYTALKDSIIFEQSFDKIIKF